MRAVLMLHSIDPSASTLSLSREEFRQLVRGVMASGHSILPLGELLASSSRNAIALTFDDGFSSLAEIALPVLNEEGAAATLFLTTGYVGRDNRWPTQSASAPHFPMLDWSGVESLHAAGWEIDAHTQSHPDLRSLGPDELAEELEAPLGEIEKRLGRKPSGFAYPYGLLDDRVVAAVGERYASAFTTRMAALPQDPRAEVEPLLLPRLDTYYLRQPMAQRLEFGTAGFRALMALRGALRRWRGHPGEHA